MGALFSLSLFQLTSPRLTPIPLTVQVRTKMGGAAPGTTNKPASALSQWAAGEGPLAKLPSGSFVTPYGEDTTHPGAAKVDKQEELLKICKDVSGVSVPGE